MSANFRSTMFAWCFFARAKNSSGVIAARFFLHRAVSETARWLHGSNPRG